MRNQGKIGFNVENKSVECLIKEKIVKSITPSVKIKRNDYKLLGNIPIISQEIEYISGYCNVIDNNIPNNEYVCFGDHSEHIKYVDFAFVQGADGLKIMLCDKNVILPKYFYYCISNNYIRHNNYERHFKYLQETIIPIIPLRNQEKIIDILDRFSTLAESMKSGIPAEIRLNRKIYEYYRDDIFESLKEIA